HITWPIDNWVNKLDSHAVFSTEAHLMLLPRSYMDKTPTFPSHFRRYSSYKCPNPINNFLNHSVIFRTELLTFQRALGVHFDPLFSPDATDHGVCAPLAPPPIPEQFIPEDHIEPISPTTTLLRSFFHQLMSIIPPEIDIRPLLPSILVDYLEPPSLVTPI